VGIALPLPLMVFLEFANGIMKSKNKKSKIQIGYGCMAIGSDRNNNAISAPLADQYSLKSPTENIFQFPPQLLPSQPTAENFVQVWQTNPLVSTCSTVPLLRFHGYFESAVLF